MPSAVHRRRRQRRRSSVNGTPIGERGLAKPGQRGGPALIRDIKRTRPSRRHARDDRARRGGGLPLRAAREPAARVLRPQGHAVHSLAAGRHAEIQRRSRARGASRTASAEHDAHRLRHGRDRQLQRVHALQPVPARDRLQGRRAGCRHRGARADCHGRPRGADASCRCRVAPGAVPDAARDRRGRRPSGSSTRRRGRCHPGPSSRRRPFRPRCLPPIRTASSRSRGSSAWASRGS